MCNTILSPLEVVNAQKMSSVSPSPAKVLQLFKSREGELIDALSNADLLKLSLELSKNMVICEVVRKAFASLDHDRLEPKLRARYLLCQVLDKIQLGTTHYDNLIRALSSVGGHVKQIVQSLNEELTGSANAARSTSVGDRQLQEHHIPHLMKEILVKCCHKWEQLGIALCLPTHTWKGCKEFGNPEMSLFWVLTKWVKQHAKDATVMNLTTALGSALVAEVTIAKEVEESCKNLFKTNSSPLECTKPIFKIVHQSSDTIVTDHKSTLLEVQVPHESVSYEWMKDEQLLNESTDFTGTSTDMLFISLASLRAEGKYWCQVSCGSNRLTSAPVTLTVHYPQDKKTLYDLYSKWKEFPQNLWPLVNVKKVIDLDLIPVNNVKNCSFLMQKEIDTLSKRLQYIEAFREYECGRLVLVEGFPGSGKTTLARKLVKDWAKEQVLKNADYLFLLSLRKDHNKSNIFETFYHTQSMEVADRLEKCSGEKVCFILDGYDEHSAKGNAESIINKLIKKEYLPLAMIIVTSRPAATVEIRQEADRIFEILGFTKEQFDKYVDNYPFESFHTNGAKFQEFLKTYTSVLNMCFLPINACIICFMYGQNLHEHILPKTETQIYKNFSLAIIFRKLRQNDPSAKKLSSIKDLNKEDKECFGQLCSLAFDMTLENKQSILELPPPLQLLITTPACGLLTTDCIISSYGLQDVFSFLHLTLQEFLAANHLADLDEDQQKKIIQLHRRTTYMLTTFKFYCALVGFKKKMYQFDDIASPVGPEDCLYMIHCANESQQPDICRRVLERIDGHVRLDSGIFTPADFKALGYVISNALDLVSAITIPSYALYDDSITKLKKIEQINWQDPPLESDSSGYLSDMLTCMNEFLCSRISYQKKPLHYYLHCKITKFYLPLMSNLVNPDETKDVKKCEEEITKQHLQSNIFTSDITKPLADALKCCRMLKSLQITGNSIEDTRSLVKMLIMNEKHIQSLTIQFAGLTSSGMVALKKGLKFCKHLCTLNLSANKLNSDSASALAKGIRACVSLKVLNLSKCGIGKDGAEIIAKGLEELSLKELNVSVNFIGPKGTLALAKTCLRTIELLDLSLNIIGSEGVTALSDELIHIKHNLVALKLANNNIDISGILSLVEGLKHVPDLKELDIASNSIGSDGAAVLTRGLKRHKNLRSLCLFQNNLCSDGMSELLDGFECWRGITMLDLSNNKLCSEGMPDLATGLKKLTDLEVLHLSQNQIDCKGAVDLVRGLRRCRRLHILNLSRNSIGCNGIASLAEKHHRIKIKILNLSYNVIGPGSETPLISLIKQGHLDLLDLSHNEIGSVGVIELAKSQESCEHRTRLNLMANNAQEISKITPIAAQMEMNILL